MITPKTESIETLYKDIKDIIEGIPLQESNRDSVSNLLSQLSYIDTLVSTSDSLEDEDLLAIQYALQDIKEQSLEQVSEVQLKKASIIPSVCLGLTIIISTVLIAKFSKDSSSQKQSTSEPTAGTLAFSSDAPILSMKSSQASGMGLKNKNPGNSGIAKGDIWAVGKGVGGYGRYRTFEEGYAGNAWNKLKYLTGEAGSYNRGVYGSQKIQGKRNPTLKQIIYTWCPPDGPGNTIQSVNQYVEQVSKWTGLDPNQPVAVTEENLLKIIAAMGRKDSGYLNIEEAKSGVHKAWQHFIATGGKADNPKGSRLVLIRTNETPTYTEGKLYLNNIPIADTLERRTPDRTRQRGMEAIHEGTYGISLGGRKYPILLTGTKEASGIEIHPGTTIQDSSGCILVGRRSGPGTLTQTQEVYKQVLARVKESKAKGYLSISVTSHYQPVAVKLEQPKNQAKVAENKQGSNQSSHNSPKTSSRNINLNKPKIVEKKRFVASNTIYQQNEHNLQQGFNLANIQWQVLT